MAEYIEKSVAKTELQGVINLYLSTYTSRVRKDVAEFCLKKVMSIPAADVAPVPCGGIGEMSDGYHTFNALYHQRLILTASLAKAHKDIAWKSWRHEDGEPCFGGGWFIVGFDTPQGGYTYHYEAKDWALFDCEELPVGKHWDGHTDADVERLLSIPTADVAPVRHGRWMKCKPYNPEFNGYECSECGAKYQGFSPDNYCPNCGAKMDGEADG